MSTTSKAKTDNQNLTRTKSLGRKPKPSEDGSDQKPEKPIPNYLKPTISSRPDPVKFLKKNSLDDNNQKLLRRRSFDRPPSSITSPSTSSSRIHVSPSRPRDRPHAVPREKSVIALRSSSFHGSRSGPKGVSTTAKSPSPPVVPKKSSSSLKSKKESSADVTKKKKEGSANDTTTKAAEKEITLDSASLSSVQEDEEECPKVENDVKGKVDIEEPKVDIEVQVDVVQADQEKEKEEDCIAVSKEVEREEEEEEKETLINEDKTEEKIEETKEQENNQDNEEEVKKKIDEDETPKKDEESVKETTEEEVKEEVKEEEKEKAKEEEASGEGKKREVVKAPSAYNDVIASKMQENPRKNKVLALAGAFQTVIDYETAASK